MIRSRISTKAHCYSTALRQGNNGSCISKRMTLCSTLPLPSSTVAASSSNTLSCHRESITSNSKSSSSQMMAAAAAAVTLVATSLSDTRSNSSTTRAEATSFDLDPNMRALGKSLQQSHERQMVRMAKLLHSLEILAEEADKDTDVTAKDGDGINENQINGKNSIEGNNNRVIHISQDEVSNLSSSPEKVWEHVELLKHGCIFGREDVKRIARAALTLLRSEPSLIDLSHRCVSKNNSRSNVATIKDSHQLKTITVVGDLHGHFDDSLLKVLEMLGNKEYGTPFNGSGAVIFNGDFVDRGEKSLEVIIALLLLKLAYPNNVYLNRGNHEDSIISTVYGCSDEIKARYGGDKIADVSDIWKEFEDVFASLPLAVRTDSAVIMHGGLPCENFSLDQIASITSEERFQVKTMVEPGPNDKTCKLMQNIMWSDPQPGNGVSPNEDRGCGMKYGPDIVRKFLADHKLKYLIRSHEPVDAGYELLECDEHGISGAVTVFSASSYPGGAGFNSGAIVRLNCDNGGDATFDTYSDSNDGSRHTLSTREKMASTFKAFADIVAKKRSALEVEFEYFAQERARRNELQKRFKYNSTSLMASETTAFATSPAGVTDNVHITPVQWADAMSYVLKSELPNVNWMSVQQFIAPGDLIDYKRFLNLHCSLSGYGQKAQGLDDKTRDTILRNHEAIFKVFRFLDADGNGEVNRAEFYKGINELKRRNPEMASSIDARALFDSIDVDKSGTIEISEFQRAFQACNVPYHVAVMMSLDEDKSGTIDRDEFKDGIKLLNARLSLSEQIPDSDEEVNKLFDELDESGDGELDVAEFEKFVRNYFPH